MTSSYAVMACGTICHDVWYGHVQMMSESRASGNLNLSQVLLYQEVYVSRSSPDHDGLLFVLFCHHCCMRNSTISRAALLA
jgi:hypothetical protein